MLVGAALLALVLGGCREATIQPGAAIALAPSPTAIVATPSAVAATATTPPSATPSATTTPLATATLPPTSTPTPPPTKTPAPRPTSTPTPHPMLPFTILGLREREYPGGEIRIVATLMTTASFTRYAIEYPSDHLTISGIMQVPHGPGPFPVVILNHGYIPPSQYTPGDDTWGTADYLASRGYLTIAPDFRGWGTSDRGTNFFRTGIVIDALNLVSSLPSLPQADPNRVGMWGHSMGGGATTKAITVDPRIKAAVLYAPVSADDREVLRKWPSWRQRLATPQQNDAYRLAVRDAEFLYLTSPINYLDFVTGPVQIHQGTEDRETPPRWAAAIRDTLLAQGKAVEYYEYPGQGHMIYGDVWWVYLDRVADFFDRNL